MGSEMGYALVGSGLSILGVGETEEQARADAADVGYMPAQIEAAKIYRCSRTVLERGGGAPELHWRDGLVIRHASERGTFLVLRPTAQRIEVSPGHCTPSVGAVVTCGHERHTREQAEECCRDQRRHGAVHDIVVYRDHDGRIRDLPAPDYDD